MAPLELPQRRLLIRFGPICRWEASCFHTGASISSSTAQTWLYCLRAQRDYPAWGSGYGKGQLRPLRDETRDPVADFDSGVFRQTVRASHRDLLLIGPRTAELTLRTNQKPRRVAVDKQFRNRARGEPGARHRPNGSTRGMMFLHRYDRVGLPCRKTIGSPSPTSTYAMVVSRTLTRFRNASASVEIAGSASGCVIVAGLMAALARNLCLSFCQATLFVDARRQAGGQRASSM
jgi:hypothetical protein